jgi:hypothetical protein
MGYPQLLPLYPPEAIRVGSGIAPEEMGLLPTSPRES